MFGRLPYIAPDTFMPKKNLLDLIEPNGWSRGGKGGKAEPRSKLRRERDTTGMV